MAWWEGVLETRILIAPASSVSLARVPKDVRDMGFDGVLSSRDGRGYAGYSGMNLRYPGFKNFRGMFYNLPDNGRSLGFLALSGSNTDHGVKENGTGSLLSLRHPKSGNATCFLYVNEMLEEINWFKQSYSSWFLGDYITEDGRLYSATPVDPVFIFLPIFEEARMKKGDDLGKFRQLDDIMFINGYPGYQHLLSVAEKSMQVVCEVKEVGSSRFFRLDDSKVLAWLYHKVHLLKKTLCTLDKNYAAREEKDTLSDAVSILGEYLKDEPWLKLLCDHLKLNFAETIKKASDAEKPTVSIENNFDSTSQDKRSGAKNTRNGKQAKKPKMETESRNIKDMFSRATRKKS